MLAQVPSSCIHGVQCRARSCVGGHQGLSQGAEGRGRRSAGRASTARAWLHQGKARLERQGRRWSALTSGPRRERHGQVAAASRGMESEGGPVVKD